MRGQGRASQYQLTCLSRIMVSSKIVLNYSSMNEVVVDGVSVCLTCVHVIMQLCEHIFNLISSL